MEIERKYLNPDFKSLRVHLEERASLVTPFHFEENLVFDTVRHDLRKAGQLLRLRTRKWFNKTQSILTFKYLPEKLDNFVQDQVKAREELELEIREPEVLEMILHTLGYLLAGKYEKFREEWHLAIGEHTCKVDLDILPFGQVVEVEGPVSAIEQTARVLHLDNLEISIHSYGTIYEKYLRKQGLPVKQNMLFELAHKESLLAHITEDKLIVPQE